MNTHYSYALSARLSKNYNSLEVRVEFGRDLTPGETNAQLISSVESTVKARVEEGTKFIASNLGFTEDLTSKKGKQSAKRKN